ncbi:MAG: hypothetical protein E5X48_14065 [Mesorhizobium sp.]|nr:MAG: hypothetical protein E5X48_14065 [Mesorhizobium sp.]
MSKENAGSRPTVSRPGLGDTHVTVVSETQISINSMTTAHHTGTLGPNPTASTGNTGGGSNGGNSGGSSGGSGSSGSGKK